VELSCAQSQADLVIGLLLSSRLNFAAAPFADAFDGPQCVLHPFVENPCAVAGSFVYFL
jgi:hypothetical protein